MSSKTHPFVVCICPTYNRREFLPYMIYMFNYQTYPKTRRHLIIVDDSPQSNADIVEKHNKDKNISYHYYSEKMPLGKKRNLLNDLALKKGAEYIACVDDDDFYPEDRIHHAIQKMTAQRAIISGSSQMYIYYVDIQKIFTIGPFSPTHATNATFVYRADFLEGRRYDDDADKAEEKKFLNDYKVPLIQIDPFKTMICIAHDSNTVDKRKVLRNSNIKPTTVKLKNKVSDKFLLNFYKKLSDEYIKREESQEHLDSYIQKIRENIILPKNIAEFTNVPDDIVIHEIIKLNPGFSERQIRHYIDFVNKKANEFKASLSAEAIETLKLREINDIKTLIRDGKIPPNSAVTAQTGNVYPVEIVNQLFEEVEREKIIKDNFIPNDNEIDEILKKVSSD